VQGENTDVLLANLVPEGAAPGPQGQKALPLHIELRTNYASRR
jgi:hypothetical protein